jgi:hypothetical protein
VTSRAVIARNTDTITDGLISTGANHAKGVILSDPE